MERVGTPAVSPDGSRVVYTVRSTDMAKNKGHTDLYLVDLRAANADAAAPDLGRRQQHRSGMVGRWRRHLFPVRPLGLVPGLAHAGRTAATPAR